MQNRVLYNCSCILLGASLAACNVPESLDTGAKAPAAASRVTQENYRLDSLLDPSNRANDSWGSHTVDKRVSVHWPATITGVLNTTQSNYISLFITAGIECEYFNNGTSTYTWHPDTCTTPTPYAAITLVPGDTIHLVINSIPVAKTTVYADILADIAQ